jgi:hypothetical protein
MYKTLQAKILSSIYTTYVLLVVILLLILIGVLPSQRNSLAKTEDQERQVLYFSPQSLSPEENLQPDRFAIFQAQDTQYVAYDDWDSIEKELATGKTRALLIHYDMLSLADPALVQTLFQTQGLVVVGIGIPGKELAHWLGIHYLDENSPILENVYKTRNYYYLFQVSFAGEDADEVEIARKHGFQFDQNGDPILPEGISHPLSTGFGISTDSLAPQGSEKVLLQTVNTYLSPLVEDK